MLTSKRGSHMRHFFGGKDAHYNLDRSPNIFNQVLEYLRSGGEYRPHDQNEHDKQLFFEELKYWGIDMGLPDAPIDGNAAAGPEDIH